LQSARAQASMSREIDCDDNASMESFFHTLKTEFVHHCHCTTRAEAERDIFAFVEARLHSSIDYISPIRMELNAA
jgi:putative transposase